MGADDDGDCFEHLWELEEVHIGRGADTVSTCIRCDAVRYEPGQAANRDRPGLDFGTGDTP